jgi:dienelactone hydrolase
VIVHRFRRHRRPNCGDSSPRLAPLCWGTWRLPLRRPGANRAYDLAKDIKAPLLGLAGHAFLADYRPSYNAAAAAEGWKRCLAHFDKRLKA